MLSYSRQSRETMTSVSDGHIILTPTQPVRSGRGSNPGSPHQESRALPTELPRTPFDTSLCFLSLLGDFSISLLCRCQFLVFDHSQIFTSYLQHIYCLIISSCSKLSILMLSGSLRNTGIIITLFALPKLVQLQFEK